MLIGSHLGENMHNSQVQEFAKAVERRIPIIVVDPRFSVAASKAKYWLPIKPGTDLALLLAWCNVLVTEGRYDRAFVEKYGHGFDKFVAEIKSYTPEWAARGNRHRRGADPHDRARVREPPAGDARASRAGASTGTATTRSAAARSRCSRRCSATGAARAGSSSPPA